MYLTQTKASFDAQAAAAGYVVGTDVASQALGNSCQVMPLNMKGLFFLRWVLQIEVPPADLIVLQLNMFAAKNGLLVAWTQT